MIKIKFSVLVILFLDPSVCLTKYCDICPEHTLCKYAVSGPSPQCVGYDTNAFLTEDDIGAILDKINDRRHFIATGRSRFLPAAANMKKIVWSKELATFAQRWVDQCDQSLKPDRKDKCRDLDDSEVGQSIVTITGSSSYEKLRVQSMVEVWFMESMDYTGSVTYYNQSREQKTNYFTQLIWADTDKAGCGKARFFVKTAKPIIVDRLVCNFAPKGNLHGKPVYTIGYAATQCEDEMERDVFWTGLCSHGLQLKDTSPTTNPPSTSFLRILNLFNNDSTRQENGPISENSSKLRKNLNHKFQINQNLNSAQDLRNNSYDAVKRSYSFNNETIWDSQQLNISTHYHGDYIQKREKAHPRVSHDRRNEFDYLHPENMNEHGQRYDYTSSTASINLYMDQERNYRKHNIDQKCTRKTEIKPSSYEVTYCDRCNKLNKCTRGLKNNYQKTNDYVKTTHKCGTPDFQTTRIPTSRYFCACNSFSTAFNPNRCIYNTDCDCINVNCPTKPCPHMLRTLKDIYDENLEKQRDFHYHDNIFPYNQHTTNRPILKDHQTHRISPDDSPWSSRLKILDRRKLQRNYSNRKRSVAEEEEENFKPFWQMDEYVNRNQPKLKSMRYTTLSNKNNLKNKRTRKQPKTTMKTESITVTFKDRSNNGKRITEKYLSFDELMHLRKHNAEVSGGRRYNDDKQILRESNTSTQTTSETTTTESPSTEDTPEYSFNTPYNRMRHCTRKLTCTWTAASLTDSAGSIIPGGGANAVGGSRTPPGYVEGCTRTSTCTRDYMNRNKMATLPVETTNPEPEPGDDEDYCERRSLNRRSNNNLSTENHNKKTSKQTKSLFNESFDNCVCNDINNRTKRQDYHYNSSVIRNKNLKRESGNHMKYESNLLSYGDLYYYVVNKIIETWRIAKKPYSHDKCFCNRINKLGSCNLFLIFIVAFNFIYILF